MKLLDPLHNSICLLKWIFLASLLPNFSTICLRIPVPAGFWNGYIPSKFTNKSIQKSLIFSSKANYARSLLLFSFCFLSQVLSTQIQEKSQNRNLIFLHIPKTGGVTVFSTIDNHFYLNKRENQYHFYATHARFCQIQKRSLNVQGVSNYDNIFTFLRDPIDRVISEHKYLMSKHGGRANFLRIHHLPPDQDPLYSIANEMCKTLSFLDCTGQFSDVYHLEAAKHFIDHCFFVGITEEMEASLSILLDKLGLPTSEYTSKFNETPSEEIFSDELKQEIAERNWADIELYDYAKQRFERDFIQWNNGREKYISEVNSPQYHILFTFDQPVNGFGWAARKDGIYQTPTGQRWVCQTNEASLIFSLDSNCDYSIRLRSIIPQLLMNDIKVYVNGTLLSTKSTFIDKSSNNSHVHVEYEGMISKDILKYGEKTEIVIKLSESVDDIGKKQLLDEWQNQRKLENCIRGIFACEALEITASS